jgi:uncharacterized protein YsxB (DUF464 family)
MTLVTFYKNSQNTIVGFRTEGHAGYADAGYDIVCAAISILVINTINAVEKFTDIDCDIISDEEEAVISLMAKPVILSNEFKVLLDALELGLSSIAADNANYLSITTKEV